MCKHEKIMCSVGELHNLSCMVMGASVTYLENKEYWLNLYSMSMAKDRHRSSLMQNSLKFTV